MEHTAVAQPARRPWALISRKATQYSTEIFGARLKSGTASSRRCVANERRGGRPWSCAPPVVLGVERIARMTGQGTRLIMLLPEYVG